VAVRTGVSDGEFTEVLEGPLSAGDTVIVDIVATAGAE
jgi:multidrug efflux pump subunit AcrA (membrane-fusion protein)